jgi:CRISPR-associated exonuclease Cas4
MEHTSETVAEGKLIGETTYPQRAEKYTEIEIAGSKIDFYDAKNKVIHEIKKSDSMEPAHQWQVKYYIWLLEQNGIESVFGVLEYPKLREKTEVHLTDDDRTTLQHTIKEIKELVQRDECPARINAKICKRCSYFDFCYIED